MQESKYMIIKSEIMNYLEGIDDKRKECILSDYDFKIQKVKYLLKTLSNGDMPNNTKFKSAEEAGSEIVIQYSQVYSLSKHSIGILYR